MVAHDHVYPEFGGKDKLEVSDFISGRVANVPEDPEVKEAWMVF